MTMTRRLLPHQLNYKHLRYFWTVAKAGSIARAAEELHLSPQAISGQLNEFEETLGVALFQRVGRGLVLTPIGQRILGYAEQIFALGNELVAALDAAGEPNATPFRIGIADAVPKMVGFRLVEPLLEAREPVRLICREGRLPLLLADLALHRLELVVADRPAPENVAVRCYDHFLGESAVAIFASAPIVEAHDAPFPACLDRAPFLLPGAETALQARLLRWFDEERLQPRIVGEFDDSALMMAFGQAGAGFFAAPTALAENVVRQYEVMRIGEVPSVREQLFAITHERRLTHPLIATVCRIAQNEMFGFPTANDQEKRSDQDK